MLNIGILVFPVVKELDFVGPYEVFSAANKLTPQSVDVKLLAFEEGSLTGASGMTFSPNASPKNAGKLDVLIIPGGTGKREALHDRRMIKFVTEQYEHVKLLGTVCTGAFLAAEAGLLHGKTATTHRRHLDELAAFPGVKVVDKKVVKDGKILTAGGVSSGIDLALCILAILFDGKFAQDTADYIEYFFRNDIYAEY